MKAFEVDQAVDVLARRQHGVFSRRQVTAAGATARMIERRVGTGAWVKLAPGVYALPSHPGTWHRALMAAVLGERTAVVGGRAAAALHGLHGFRPGHPELFVPPRANCRSSLATIHRCADYRSTRVDRIPVLTLCDTFFAVSGRAETRVLAHALDDVLADKRLRVAEMQRRYLSWLGSRRPGLLLMGSLLEERGVDGYTPPASVLEAGLYDLLDRPGMPPCLRQVGLPWSSDERVDALLCGSRTIVEADGRRWHARVADFERDRRRDRLASVHGHQTLRVTYEELLSNPDGVARDILAVHRSRLTG